MQIYTSYFSRLRAIDQKKMIPVAVSRGIPAWYSGHVMQEMAPSWDLVKKMKSCTTRQMGATEYLCQTLYPLCPKQIRSRLQAISQGKDVVLLCWESAGEFCHRHLIAAWLGEDPEQCELSFD
jgi:Protein of unknown function, DUF488.